MKLFNRKKKVFCYYCGEEMLVSLRAFSVSCPRCHQRLSVDDQVVSTIRSQPQIETCGSMMVTATGRLRARLRVYNLNVEGQVLGSVTADGTVSINEGAKVTGNITARSLIVEPGATISGFCRIEPRRAEASANPADEPLPQSDYTASD